MKPDEFKVSKPQKQALLLIYRNGELGVPNFMIHKLVMRSLAKHGLVQEEWHVAYTYFKCDLTELGLKIAEHYARKEKTRG